MSGSGFDVFDVARFNGRSHASAELRAKGAALQVAFGHRKFMAHFKRGFLALPAGSEDLWHAMRFCRFLSEAPRLLGCDAVGRSWAWAGAYDCSSS